MRGGKRNISEVKGKHKSKEIGKKDDDDEDENFKDKERLE